jgi:uncharacterized protein YndB with AHSA1/START domain
MRLRASLPAPPSGVYTALTEPVALRAWLAEHASDEGFWGRSTPQGDQPHQELVAAEPGRRLRFHWLLDDEKTIVDTSRAALASAAPTSARPGHRRSP